MIDRRGFLAALVGLALAPLVAKRPPAPSMADLAEELKRIYPPENFLRGIVDDGTYVCRIHGISRTTYPKLKANVDARPTLFMNEPMLRQYMELVR